jgi:threonine dehydrogenase-like Zn-dependent dehydrogenase
MESKGIILKGDGQTEIITASVPAPTGSQVLVRTHAVGLCGSDVGLYLGTYEGPRNYPLYFGHEWSGTVEAVGPDVTRLQAGDRVTGDCSIYCGECEFCARDRNLCQTIEKLGITVDGASRQRFVQEERYLYRADPDANLDLVALSEPLAVAAHAARKVREMRPKLSEERILILGGGTIGLSCLFALKTSLVCRHVELYDLVPSRVQQAIQLGAQAPSDVLAAGSQAESYGGLYSGRGYDAIFETSGAPPAFLQAVELLRPVGTIMALGFIPDVSFSLKQITLKAATIAGSIGGTGEFDRVLAFTRDHPDLAGALVTARVPFQNYREAFEMAMDRSRSMKVLIQFGQD